MKSTLRLVRYIAGPSKLIFIGVVAAPLQAALLAPVGLLVRRIVDTILPRQDVPGLVIAGGLIMLAFVISAALAVATRSISLRVSKAGISRVRHELVDRVLAMPRERHTASAMSASYAAIVNDSERVDVLANLVLTALIPRLAVCAALTVVLLILNPVLTLALLCLAPALFALHQRLRPALLRRAADFHTAFDEFGRRTMFLLGHIDLVRVQVAERAEAAAQKQAVQALSATGLEMAVASSRYGEAQGVVLGASTVIIFIGGGLAVMSGAMTVGSLVSFYVTVAILRDQLGAALSTLPGIEAGYRALARIEALLGERDTEPYTGTAQISTADTFELDQVSFGYTDTPVLEDVSLRLRRGRSLALVGPNGVGKTTVLHLLLGFYRPWSGQVSASGVPYDDVSMASLRRQVGVLSQPPAVFDGSVRANLTYGREHTEDDEVQSAIRLAGAEFVHDLPDGLDTMVGDHGVRLSGGQRQRIVLARALMGNPALVALDEPTTNLDSDAVKHLLDGLARLRRGAAVLVITHDHAVAAACDDVVYLEGTVTAHDAAALERLVAVS